MSHLGDHAWQIFWSCTRDQARTSPAAANVAAAMVTMPDAIAYLELGIGVPVSVPVALLVGTDVVVMRRPCLWVVPSARVVAVAVPGFVSIAVAPACEVSI